MKTIYFVIEIKGHYRGYVTTNEKLVNQYMKKNPNAEILKTELKEIDFTPQQGTIIGRMGSMDWKYKERNVDFSKFLCFSPVYDKQHRQWRQLIYKEDLLKFDKLIECLDFSDYLLESNCLYLLPEGAEIDGYR